jgi:hypothetical protein
VAVLARERDVRSGEREFGGVVIELGARPLDRRMADGAVGGESGSDVVWVRGGLVLRKVTARTRCRSAGILATDVARSTRRIHVSTGQRELRICVVIELCTGPLDGSVTGLACGGECRRDVVGVGCLLVVRQVA